jgi:acetate kinase
MPETIRGAKLDVAFLILNGGSTGWKIAVYRDVGASDVPVVPAVAEVELAWQTTADDLDAHLALNVPTLPATTPIERSLRVGRGKDAIDAACEAMRDAGVDLGSLRAVGHRIVHGGPRFSHAVRIDDEVERALVALEPLAPAHNARERMGVDAARELFPDVTQVAVFDTAFHRTLPPEAFTFPGPYAWYERDIRRYGFHGLSVGYCVERAAQILARPVSACDLIVAHLGGGCSVTAVRGGQSVDTSMGFTPLDGTMMGTRSGAIDPSVLTYLMRERGDDGASATDVASELDAALNEHSGLLGISGVSGDLRLVEHAADTGNERATLAREMFAHRAAMTIAAMSSSLGRLDALVFTGGIGERAGPMRARICGKLGLLGIALDVIANEAPRTEDARIESTGPPILVIDTHEEWYAARECARVLDRT